MNMQAPRSAIAQHEGTRLSARYLTVLRMAHAELPEYGRGGLQFYPVVRSMIDRQNFRSLLDYGCGKGAFVHLIRHHFSERLDPIGGYDPAVAGFDEEPPPAEIVTCFDVLDFVEPRYLRHVLQHIAGLTRSTALFAVESAPVDSGPSRDVQPSAFWRSELETVFEVIEQQPFDIWMLFACRPRPSRAA